MRLELAERLQCPGAHPPTPLVVVASQVVDRDLRRGTAGCMRCGCEARFDDGDLWFGARADPNPAAPIESSSPESPAPEALDRLQALLGLAEPGGAVLLGGRYAASAAGLQSRLDVMVVVFDPTDARFTSATRIVGCTDGMPFTDETFRAAALDASSHLAIAVRTVRSGGRILAPIDCGRPSGVIPLASDASEWVGERGAALTVIPLQRAPVDAAAP